MRKYKKQKGFSLIELLLVMGLSSLAFISLIQWEVKKADILRAEAGGEQFNEVGKALASYIARNQVQLNTAIATGANMVLPVTDLMGTTNTVAGVIARSYLPTTFNTTSSFGTNYTVQISNTLGRIDGVVLSSSPICEKGSALACPSANNVVKYDWIGAAMRKIGAQSGMTGSASATTLSGFNAGWTLSNAQFPQINASGILGVRVSSTDSTIYDAQYLRLDGTSVMRGDMNLGNFNITNATNITATGWLTGLGVLANTVNSGSINNTGTIQTANLTATTNIIAGVQANIGNSAAIGTGYVGSDGNMKANGRITAMTNMATKDIFLGSTDANVNAPGASSGRVVPNAWLSDLLPKYSSRGIYSVTDGQILAMPACGTGTPKIELIPQITYTQGRVLGPLSIYTVVAPFTTWMLSQDQYSYNPLAVWANVAGPNWIVHFSTTVYGAPTFVMSGLAHVYCDYNF